MGKVKKGPRKGMSDARKKAAPQKALNPFEVHVNRQKFQVLGRKSKADRGLPGVARAKALKKVNFLSRLIDFCHICHLVIIDLLHFFSLPTPRSAKLLYYRSSN